MRGGCLLPHVGTGLFSPAPRRTQPVVGGAEPPEGLGVKGVRLLLVLPRPVRRLPGSRHGLGGVLQLSGVAHLGRLAQRCLLGPQTFTGLGQGADLLFGRRSLLLGAGPALLVLGQISLYALVAGVLGAREPGAAPGGDPGVPPVVLQEGGGGPLGGGRGGQLFLLLVQGAERLGHVGDDGLVHGRQRLGEGAGESGFVGPLGELGLAQLDEQVDQGGVALLSEAE